MGSEAAKRVLAARRVLRNLKRKGLCARELAFERARVGLCMQLLLIDDANGIRVKIRSDKLHLGCCSKPCRI